MAASGTRAADNASRWIPRPHFVKTDRPLAFREGLAVAGFVEGRNVTIEPRFAENHSQLVRFAAELVQRQVAVIVALDSDPPVFAAKAATSTIPIVFRLSSDPIKRGLITSLSRPVAI